MAKRKAGNGDVDCEAHALELVGRVAARTRPLGRAGFGLTVALGIGLYAVGAVAPSFSNLNAVYGWSLVAMVAVPAWASLAVLLGSALAFPAERQRGTLDALRLTPLPTEVLAHAVLRDRLRVGLMILLLGAPFYLAPHNVLDRNSMSLIHIGTLSTFWRPIIGWAGLQQVLAAGQEQGAVWWHSLLSGPAAYFIDATRLYAFAAIGTAVSLRAQSAGRAVLWAVLFGGVFLLTTAAAEWAGALLFFFMARRDVAGSGILVAVALVASALWLEGWVGNVVVPRGILNATARRAEEWLAGEA
jgi:hypothetical protein